MRIMCPYLTLFQIMSLNISLLQFPFCIVVTAWQPQPNNKTAKTVVGLRLSNCWQTNRIGKKCAAIWQSN